MVGSWSTKKQEIIGNKYGRLVVTREIDPAVFKSGPKRRYECMCDCGNTAVAIGAELKSGRVRSCGCLKKDPEIDLTGARFFRLTVKEKTRVKNGKLAWKCKCECGNETIVITQHLNNGSVKSCGCLKRDSDLYRNIPERPLYAFIRIYERGAIQRNLVWDISDREAESMMLSKCYYCGSEPCMTRGVRSKSFSGTIKYNGIDRVDNSIGYIASNCVPCCTICNRAKSNLSLDKFEEWICNVIKYRGAKI